MATATRIDGNKIRSARLTAGMTQAQLARSIRTTERNIARWESGQNQPRVESLVAIATATGHDLSFFLGDGEDDDEEAAPAMREAFVLFVDLMDRLQGRARAEVAS